jgi:alkylated DNA repair dioxygenase AlkB
VDEEITWLPDGLALLPDFITPDREEEIVSIARDAIELGRDDPFLKRVKRRRLARFGFTYDDSQVVFSVAPLVQIAPIPASLKMLADEVRTALVVEDAFDAVAVNAYAAGDGIHPHIDTSQFAELIAVVSIGGASVTTFTREHRSFAIRIPPRSLFVIRGQARYDCAHAVEADPTLEGIRYSIVFRTRAT